MSERQLFEQALDIHDPAERAAFLERACADQPDLRRQIEQLLKAHEQAGQFLDQPHPAAGAVEQTGPYASRSQRTETAGTIIAGKYKLLQRIGEGGMGSVWMADQLEPVKRRVAVKLIRTERDGSRTILSRFEAERQAIALMDHPHIAKLLDAGTVGEPGASATGAGAPISPPVANAPGSPFFVMELVKGIPLTEFCDQHKLSIGERLKLFMQICSAVQHAHQKGIIHRDLKPTNILVESHDGKPVPKVIDFGLAKAMSGQPLTEHTLFTALGTVAGTPLYMAPEQAAFNAIDVDTRADIYALGVILYELLTGSTPIERETFKKAAFDEILRVIREVEPPTPSKRLSSTESKPSVAANRQTEPLKLGRFVKGELDWIVMKALAKERDRRYDTANGFAKDVERFLNHEPVLAGPPSASYRVRKFVQRNKGQVIAASLILIALLAGMAGTTFGLIRANRAADAERLAKLEAQDERKKAVQAEDETLADYRASTDDAIEQLISSKPELGPKEKAYLENTLKRWQTFANRQGDDERSRAIRGEGHFRVALLWQKLGRTEEARMEYQVARDLRKKLVEQFPVMPEYQDDLARTNNNLGILLVGLGKLEEARAEWEAARDLQKKLIEQFPAMPEYQQGLATNHNNLGNVLADLRKLEEARAEWEAARDLQKNLIERFPAVPAYQQELARTHFNLGRSHQGPTEREEARAAYLAACDLQKKLVERSPAVPEYQQELARTHSSLGFLLAELEKREQALAEYQTARDLRKKLAEQFPAKPEYQQDLARTHGLLGLLLAKMGMHEEARVEYQASRSLQKKLVEQFPAAPEYQIELGGSYCNYGNLIVGEGNAAASLQWFGLAIQTLKPVHDKTAREVTATLYLRNSHWCRAAAYDRLKKPAEAIKDWERAIELSPPAEQLGLRARRATSRLQAGLVAEAIAEVAELTKSSNWNADQWYDFACASAVGCSKIADRKQEYADRAMELLQKAVKAGYKDAAHMKKDTDLDPLRERDDFKKLLAELEAGKTK